MTTIELPGEGIKIYIRTIDADSGSRRAAERKAIDSLSLAVLGRVPGHTPGGAPIIEGHSISVSHSRTLAALGVGPEGKRFGIDIEEMRAELSRVAPRVLSENELALYGTDLRGLLYAWTVKEAAYKATGGATPDFRSQIKIDGTDVKAGPFRARVAFSAEVSSQLLSVVVIDGEGE